MFTKQDLRDSGLLDAADNPTDWAGLYLFLKASGATPYEIDRTIGAGWVERINQWAINNGYSELGVNTGFDTVSTPDNWEPTAATLAAWTPQQLFDWLVSVGWITSAGDVLNPNAMYAWAQRAGLTRWDLDNEIAGVLAARNRVPVSQAQFTSPSQPTTAVPSSYTSSAPAPSPFASQASTPSVVVTTINTPSAGGFAPRASLPAMGPDMLPQTLPLPGYDGSGDGFANTPLDFAATGAASTGGSGSMSGLALIGAAGALAFFLLRKRG